MPRAWTSGTTPCRALATCEGAAIAGDGASLKPCKVMRNPTGLAALAFCLRRAGAGMLGAKWERRSRNRPVGAVRIRVWLGGFPPTRAWCRPPWNPRRPPPPRPVAIAVSASRRQGRTADVTATLGRVRRTDARRTGKTDNAAGRPWPRVTPAATGGGRRKRPNAWPHSAARCSNTRSDTSRADQRATDSSGRTGQGEQSSWPVRSRSGLTSPVRAGAGHRYRSDGRSHGPRCGVPGRRLRRRSGRWRRWRAGRS